MSPGIVVTDLLVGDYDVNPDAWGRAKRAFNVLATPWRRWRRSWRMASRDGAQVVWLTGGKAMLRFLTAAFRKRDLFATFQAADAKQLARALARHFRPSNREAAMDNYQIARRARIGVLIPSTNTGVEYDLQKFALEGVTWHPSRFWIELRNWADENAKTGEGMDSVFERFLDMMRGELPGAVDRALSAEITHLMLGMSAETFWGGLAGNEAFEQDIQERIGQLGLSTGAAATRQALSAFGATTISVITPYPPVGDANVRRFFNEIGFEVKHVAGLSRPSATAIAATSIQQVMAAVRQVDGDDVDAIVQCGTNLSTVDIFPTLELWLEKPLIPINIATIWHSLRACGVDDRITGKGRLLEEF